MSREVEVERREIDQKPRDISDGEWLHLQRRRKGWKLTRAARLARIRAATLSLIESDQARPHPTTIQQLLDIYGLESL